MRVLELAFPYRDAVPTHLCQLPLLFLIPFLIPLNLFLPEVRIRLRHPEVLTTIMPMPKAAIDKHARAILSQYNIRVTGEARIVETVAEAMRPEIAPHNQFRACVFAADCRHVRVALGWCKNVHHYIVLYNQRCLSAFCLFLTDKAYELAEVNDRGAILHGVILDVIPWHH